MLRYEYKAHWRSQTNSFGISIVYCSINRCMANLAMHLPFTANSNRYIEKYGVEKRNGPKGKRNICLTRLYTSDERRYLNTVYAACASTWPTRVNLNDDSAFSLVREIRQRSAARSLIWRGGRAPTCATACCLSPRRKVKGKNPIKRALTLAAETRRRCLSAWSVFCRGGRGSCVVTK